MVARGDLAMEIPSEKVRGRAALVGRARLGHVAGHLVSDQMPSRSDLLTVYSKKTVNGFSSPIR